MTTPMLGLSSMATRGLLAELAEAWDGRATMTATGGIDAAHRVREGEPTDVVVLARPVMCKLEAEEHLLSGSLVDLARSAIALAVRDGAPALNLSISETVRDALLSAGRIGYSTGPSGDYLLSLLQRWGIHDTVRPRLVQSPPGMPVGRLLAEGVVDLAIQQRSELMGLSGITIAGPLPAEIALDTVFTAGVARTSLRVDAARAFIDFLASPHADEAKWKHGMQPI